VARIRALLEKEQSIDALSAMPVLQTTEGLSDHEIVALVTVAKNAEIPGGEVSAWTVKRDCEGAGYTGIAVTLALRGLLRRGYIKKSFDMDERGQQYGTYVITEHGLDWLETNQNRLVLRRRPKKKTDDVPF